MKFLPNPVFREEPRDKEAETIFKVKSYGSNMLQVRKNISLQEVYSGHHVNTLIYVFNFQNGSKWSKL